jgi:hypothetical protein
VSQEDKESETMRFAAMSDPVKDWVSLILVLAAALAATTLAICVPYANLLK